MLQVAEDMNLNVQQSKTILSLAQQFFSSAENKKEFEAWRANRQKKLYVIDGGNSGNRKANASDSGKS